VIVEMHVIFEDRPAGDVVFKGLDQQANLDKLKKSAVVFKESCHYKLKFVFRVQHDIVTGLRYHNGVYKAGIRVAKEDLMLGSYPPQEACQEVVWPRHGWEEAPSGMLARGSYKSTIKFIDDDDATHLQFDYGFSIKKDWGKDKDKEEE
jgi:Rho GDP-dissociation inhibitor